VSLGARLNRLTPALSGKERAILVLRNFKEKKKQDYRLGQGMDSAEIREYNRLIRLMNACNLEVLTIVILLRERSAKIDLKLGWLATLEMWCEHAEMVELYSRGPPSGQQKLVGDFELPALDEDEVSQNLEFIHYFAERQAQWSSGLGPGAGRWSSLSGTPLLSTSQ